MIWLKRLLLILLAVSIMLIGMWIYMENKQEVAFVLPGIPMGQLPTAVWVLGAFSVGTLLGGLLTLPSALHSRRLARRYRQRLIDSERKVAKFEALKQS